MYIPVNIKTDNDLMNSLIKIDEIISYAINNNINTIGITDTNLFGTYEFLTKCKKNNINGIVGSELLIDNKSFILYAMNYDGLVNLFKIVSYKNIFDIDMDVIKKYNSNIICVCNYKDYDFFNNLFDYVYLGYSNKEEKNSSCVLTNNIVFIPKICYLNKEDKEYYKYLKYIDEKKDIDEEIIIKDLCIDVDYSNEEVINTKKFVSLINIELPDVKMHIPIYKEDSVSFLRALSKKGLEKRLGGVVSDKYKDRLKYELSVIEQMNFVDYFLIVYDLVLYAKKNDILVGPGRGSGASSLVNYSLGIIDIDPLKYDLIFERFLNPGRVTMPDIDVDFESNKRGLIIDYLINKYGSDKVARIISFNTMAPKAVLREVSKVLKIDNVIVDNLTKKIDKEKDFEELKNNKEFMMIVRRNDRIKNLVNICSRLCNLKRDTSITAAGVVISDIPLNDIMPLYKSNDNVLTGYSKEYIESQGLLKMDILSIKNLDYLYNIISEVKIDNKDFDINKISLDDKKTFDVFKNSYTNGIFQFETSLMKRVLSDLNVSNFNDLIDAIALSRPGARDSIPDYIAYKTGKKKIDFKIKELNELLSSTYGVIIYQEQVLEILKKLGGFSYSEADNVRRAMSKKNYKLIEESRDKFIKGLSKLGYDSGVSNELFDQISAFAGYGFNKSHSVVYTHLAYQMAYLKANYSVYFMKNLLNNSISTNIKEYINESKYFNVDFINIDINKSFSEFVINGNKIVIPFTLIKDIKKSTSEFIVEKRKEKPFDSFIDFMIRCYGDKVNKNNVISLIECNAFKNINKKLYIQNIDEIINYINLCRDLNTILSVPSFEYIDDYSDSENIFNEIKNYGFYISNHPIVKYDRKSLVNFSNYKEFFNKNVNIMLMVEKIKTIKTKNGDDMAFVSLSDENGVCEGILFPDVFSKNRDIKINNIYIFNSKVEKRGNNWQLIVNSIKKVQ